MGDCFLRIDRFDNGYTVEIKDPAVVKANAKRDAMPYDSKAPRDPWKDPWKTFVFKTDAEVLAFLTKNMKKAVVSSKADDAYSTSFDVAAGADDD